MKSSLPDVIFEPFLCLSRLPNTPLVVLKRPRCELGSNCTACAVDCYQQTLSTWPPPDGLSQSERGSGWEGAGGGVGGDQDGEARARCGRGRGVMHLLSNKSKIVVPNLRDLWVIFIHCMGEVSLDPRHEINRYPVGSLPIRLHILHAKYLDPPPLLCACRPNKYAIEMFYMKLDPAPFP